MSIVPMKELLKDAYEKGYAVPAINVSNMETVMAVLEKAYEMKSPIILQIAPIQIQNQNISYDEIVKIIKIFSKRFNIRCAIHQDHSMSVDECIKAVDGGFTSVMFDGSKLSYEENKKGTIKVVEYCKEKDITVEAELGKVGGAEGEKSVDDDNQIYTDPELAKDFASKTKIDSLAVAIGNAHGFYSENPKIDFERLERLRKNINIPMVLHGGSGIPDEDIQKAIKKGIAKINFFTEIDFEFTKKFALEVTNNKNIYMMSAIEKARQAMMKKIEEKIRVCMSGGRI